VSGIYNPGSGGSGSGLITLTEDTNLYVNGTTGNDSNPGTIGSPFKTIGKAMQTVSLYNAAGQFQVIVNVADGTYNEDVFPPFIIGTLFNSILGNGTNPQNCIVQSFQIIAVGNWAISGFQLNGANANELVVSNFSNLYLGTMNFCSTQGNPCIFCAAYGSVQTFDEIGVGNLLIQFDHSSFINADENSFLGLDTINNFTLVGTPNFGQSVILLTGKSEARVVINGSIVGTATGPQYNVFTDCTFLATNTNRANFPGSSFGTLSNGIDGKAVFADGSTDNRGDETVGTATSIVIPLTGFSVSLTFGIGTLILNPAATLAAGTVTLMASPDNRQHVKIKSTKNVTALTIAAGSGETIVGSPGTIVAGSLIDCYYDTGTNSWYL
jgi:hypothetical protein